MYRPTALSIDRPTTGYLKFGGNKSLELDTNIKYKAIFKKFSNIKRKMTFAKIPRDI